MVGVSRYSSGAFTGGEKLTFVQDSAVLAQAEKPSDRQVAAEVNDLSPHPELHPSYDRLVEDDDGRLRLGDWEGVEAETFRRWVFDRDGGLLGYVDMPGRFRLGAVRLPPLREGRQPNSRRALAA